MDTTQLEAILRRIDERLKALKMSDSAASKLAGKPEVLRNIRRALDNPDSGRRSMTVETLSALANVLQTTPAWLLGAAEPENSVANESRNEPYSSVRAFAGHVLEMPIAGTVEAGAWREVSATPDSRELKIMPIDGRFPGAKQFLLRVVGDSMDLAKPQPFISGALARCVAWADTGLSLHAGQIIVARRTRGDLVETTLKRVAETPDAWELRPESSNPKHKPLRIPRTAPEIEDQGEAVEVIALVTGITYDFAF